MSKEKQSKISSTKQHQPARPAVETGLSNEFPWVVLFGGSTGLSADDPVDGQRRELHHLPLQSVQRSALAASIGHVQGNQHLKHLIGNVDSLPVPHNRIQRALPLPQGQMPQFSGIGDEARQQLLETTRTYLGEPNESNGQAVVDAAVTQLGSTVQYNQSFITDDSPDFRSYPSGRASDASGGTVTDSVSGFTYTYSTEPLQFKVEIYPRAFIGNSPEESLAYLMGVIVHEYIHTQQFNRQAQPGASQFSDAQTELQAWAWQAQNAVAMGLARNTMGAQQIISNISHYWQAFLATNPSTGVRNQYRQLATDACEALGRDPDSVLST